MKTETKFLLIGSSFGFLGYISFYTIPEVIIITNIFILVGGGFIGIGAIIGTRDTLKRLDSYESDKTKDDD